MDNAFQLRNENFEVSLNKLDDSQRAAVDSNGENVVIRASAGSGKALVNSTKVLTINGYKRIDELTFEDKVAAEDGNFYNIVGIYPQGEKEVYQITFSDRSIINCCEDHLWTWQSSYQRSRTKKWQTSTTLELSKKSLQTSNGHWDVYVPMAEEINFPKQEVPIEPYLLGCLLGDGNMSDRGLIFTNAEKDVLKKVDSILNTYNCHLEYINNYDYAIKGEKGYGYHNVQDIVGASVSDLGLRGTDSHTKFIPDIYKYNSPEIRLAILQGLIDTDGYCEGSHYEFTLASKQLILDIKWLCESLGFTATYSEKDTYCSNSSEGHKKCGTGYRLYIKTSQKYPKIHTSINKESRWKKGQSYSRRTIQEIKKLDYKEEMTCIEVDSPNHLFVIENCIVTHNTSTLITAIAAYRYERLNDRICAITYTRAARAEMEERLRAMGIYDVEVTTIHVWARNLLNDLGLKYDFKVRILEEMDIKTILEELVQEYYIRNGRRTKINIGILYSYITGNKNMDITDGYRRTLNTLEEHYIRYKRSNNLYDFTDYPLYLYDVLNFYDEYILNIDALFVDEFQDVDEIQFEVFKKVITKKKFFIGDSWQSIFIFRGADGAVFKKLEDFDLYKLDYNYRSYQEIIDYACTVYQELKPQVEEEKDAYITSIYWSDPSSIICSRGYGGEVTIIDPFGKGVYIYNNKRSRLEMPIKNALEVFIDKNPMILCRTNKQVKEIKEKKGYSNVSTVHQAKGLEYDNVLIIDTTIKNMEDLNIAYVALTRAKNSMFVINWSGLEQYWLGKSSGFSW